MKSLVFVSISAFIEAVSETGFFAGRISHGSLGFTIATITDPNTNFHCNRSWREPRIFLNRFETFMNCERSVQLDPLVIVAME